MDGEGARLAGGRWNHPGTAIIYTSESLALAALETLVHVRESEMPDDLVYIAIDIPASVRIARVRIAQLPRNWRRYPAPQQLADIGSRWAQSGRTAVLAAPSAVTRLEWNYLVNPVHPAFRQLRIPMPESFRLDPRLLE